MPGTATDADLFTKQYGGSWCWRYCLICSLIYSESGTAIAPAWFSPAIANALNQALPDALKQALPNALNQALTPLTRTTPKVILVFTV